MGNDYSGLGLKQLFEQLGTSENGLSSVEAEIRLGRSGRNEISEKDRRGASVILLSQFRSPLILILVAASIIAGFLGEMTEAAIIIGIILLNTALGFYQEFKSERALAELRRYVSFRANVLRDERKTWVDVRGIVPGDVVFLGIGDLVPADMRLIDAEELTVNESVVTGESLPVHKAAEAGEAQPESGNAVFMGTTVTSGLGVGVVVVTGKNTRFGKTATVLSAKEPPTDFQKNIKRFGSFLVKVIIELTVLVFATNALLGRGLLDSFLFALALAVGITPELLPIIITIGLSAGAIHLAKRKVVVKRLVAIEDLGNVDVLCMDKTGTLTENRISLEKAVDSAGIASKQVLELALLCNSATVYGGIATGNSIDVAIWNHAKGKEVSTESYRKVGEVGFDYERRRASVIAEKMGKRILVCKGAPESILGVCSRVRKGGKSLPVKAWRAGLVEKFERLSAEGFRVIAVASKEIALKENYNVGDEAGLGFEGFLTFLDPPKKSAMQSLKSFQDLGVELKLLTGDNELVTGQICRQVGLETKGKIVLGGELEKMGEREFLKAIEENNVFSRINPEQKFRVVAGLSKLGHIVGFLGDGVNDAPALKAADVGITVDSAVDVAKDSADIILLKKSLMVLVDGIKEGRKTFGNIIKYIFNTVSANFGNMFTLAVSSFFLDFIPLLPSQILLANLISDWPLMAISTDNVDPDYLHKPKRWSIKAISRFMIFFGAISSVFDFLTIGLLLFAVRADPATFRTAWFLESTLSEIIVTFAIRTKRSFWRSKPSRMLVLCSLGAILLTIGLIYSPLAFLFKFEQIAIPLLAGLGIVLFMYFWLTEATKKGFYRSVWGKEDEQSYAVGA